MPVTTYTPFGTPITEQSDPELYRTLQSANVGRPHKYLILVYDCDPAPWPRWISWLLPPSGDPIYQLYSEMPGGAEYQVITAAQTKRECFAYLHEYVMHQADEWTEC